MSVKDKIRVALVDDDTSVCRALGRLLSAAGMESIAYHSAEDFLTEVTNLNPDCLLLDIQLGGMSGFDLQNALEVTGKTVPIIFITAQDEPEIRARAARSNCVAYVRKTDPGQMVLDAIQRAMAMSTASRIIPCPP